MSGHKHYVPILKTKAGERWAIDHTRADRKDSLTPLFEIHRHRTNNDVEHAGEMCDSLASIWGTARPLFLDTCWLHPASGDPVVIEATLAHAREIGLRAIPVVRLGYDDASLDTIADAVAADGRGWMLRIVPTEVNAHDRIGEVVAHLGVAHNSVDLLLDYKTIAMHLPAHVAALPNVMAWRTFSAASAAFPRSLTHLQHGMWHQIDRTDWQSWQMGIASGDLQRVPAYADYTIRDPGPTADFGDPSVNLRYTKEAYWLARVERKFKEGYAGDMHTICASLIARPEFNGAQFSAGDAEIADAANPALDRPGAPQQWLQWGMNHHIAVTVQQVSALP